uniref:Uncharacterized protein n=2 Tax=Oryza TaxID=4527 RepID=A0A679BBF1_9ORYZ|nr:hypothetical protein [Oryza barthii]BBF89221.1 hypothetical protein [Oryza barthii]BBF89456.1 hypothetical protein [Oryza glaberrima]
MEMIPQFHFPRFLVAATCKHAPLKWNQTGWLQLMEFSSCRCRFEAEATLHNMWY